MARKSNSSQEVSQVEIRAAYSPRVRLTTPVIGESKTHQSFKEECDPTNIVNRFAKGLPIDHVARVPPTYQDCGSADFHGVMNLNRKVQEAFDQLPYDEKLKYDNDALAWALTADQDDLSVDPDKSASTTSNTDAAASDPRLQETSPASQRSVRSADDPPSERAARDARGPVEPL